MTGESTKGPAMNSNLGTVLMRTAAALAFAAGCNVPVSAGPTLAADTPKPPARAASSDSDTERLSKAIAAVVKIKAKALPNARSLATLGAEREGSAIVVGANNLL